MYWTWICKKNRVQKMGQTQIITLISPQSNELKCSSMGREEESEPNPQLTRIT